ncbi:hypothetical protein [Streptomyces sp. NPDC094049]|uniref:hypothetical protein n=1 Tax=Streptomyces sp. NPDC094049 TaxID=3154987 RepID=UPI0033315171
MTGSEPAVCQDKVTAGPGGAMTVEVGFITGDLTLRTSRRTDGLVHVAVQYPGVEEWYTLTGSPTPVPDGALQTIHTTVLTAVENGGQAETPA